MGGLILPVWGTIEKALAKQVYSVTYSHAFCLATYSSALSGRAPLIQCACDRGSWDLASDGFLVDLDNICRTAPFRLRYITQ